MRTLILILGLLSLNSHAQNMSIKEMVDTSCMSCHNDQTMYNAPMLSGQKKDFLEFELFNFRDYVRDHEIMNQIMEDFSDDEVKEIASYISSLSLCDAQADVDLQNDTDITKGEKIFKRSCFECHKKDTSGIAPVIHGQKTWYIQNAIKSFQTTWYEPRPSRMNMKNHTDMLSKQDIKDVATYLNQQKLCN